MSRILRLTNRRDNQLMVQTVEAFGKIHIDHMCQFGNATNRSCAFATACAAATSWIEQP